MTPRARICFYMLDTATLSPEDLSAARDMLDPAEQARAHRLPRESQRRTFIASRALCRRVLSRETGQDARDLRFSNRDGRLTLAPCAAAAQTDLAFSVTRTRGIAGIAVARGCAVGCDAERARPDLARRQTVELICMPDEAARWLALPAPARIPAFFDLWTAKESLLKMTGTGLGGATGISCAFDPFRVTDVSSAAAAPWTVWRARRADVHLALAAQAMPGEATICLKRADGLTEDAPLLEDGPLEICGTGPGAGPACWTLDPASG